MKNKKVLLILADCFWYLVLGSEIVDWLFEQKRAYDQRSITCRIQHIIDSILFYRIHIVGVAIWSMCILACATTGSDEDGGTDSFWENDEQKVDIDFSVCKTGYLFTLEQIELRFEHSGQQLTCPVEAEHAVTSRELIEGEAIPNEDIWLPVQYELCRGWVESSKLRCPNEGEKPLWLYLPVPYHNQMSETDSERWSPSTACMSTALTMLLDYYGFEDDVNEITALAADIEPEVGGYDPTCSENPVCASAGAGVQIVEKYCSSVHAGDGWTHEDLIASLEEGNPVFVVVTGGFVPGSFGHGIVITGYLDEGDGFIYHDPMHSGDRPFDEGNQVVRWDSLSASWEGPIDEGDPLQPEGHSYFGLACSI